jgi:hypothetical protein
MHWLYLLLAFGALLLAITTAHGWLLLLSLLAAVALLVAWMRGWYLERIGGGQQDEIAAIIDPAELRRLRELAAARKQEATRQASHDQAPPAA